MKTALDQAVKKLKDDLTKSNNATADKIVDLNKQHAVLSKQFE